LWKKALNFSLFEETNGLKCEIFKLLGIVYMILMNLPTIQSILKGNFYVWVKNGKIRFKNYCFLIQIRNTFFNFEL